MLNLKTYFILFLIVLGAIFFIGALVTDGPTVGKFKKGFCFVFGGGMMLMGTYLAT